MGRKEKTTVEERKGGFLTRSAHESYAVFSNVVEPAIPLLGDLGTTLLRSRIKISFRAYATLLIFFPLVTGTGVIAATFLIGTIFQTAPAGLFLLSLATGVIFGVTSFAVVYIYPSIRAGSRKRMIDEELPYTVSHMAVLSAAGITPESMLRMTAKSYKSATADEMTDIIRDIDMLGKDLISALKDAGMRTASVSFSEVIEGMIASTVSGGDLKKYLYDKGRALLETKRISIRELADNLSIVSEVYVSLLVVFPLTVIIMFSVMAGVSSAVAGVSILMLMYLVAYVLIPMLSGIVMILLDAMVTGG